MNDSTGQLLSDALPGNLELCTLGKSLVPSEANCE